jgi:Fe2+ transport system protein FeoA
MKLLDAKVNKLYIVKDIQLCDPCNFLDSKSCMILSLMEKGLVPGSTLEVKSKKLGMYELLIDGSHFIVRQPEMEKYNIEIE